MEPLRVFVGYDKREAAGWHAFTQSIIETSSVPIAIVPLSGEQRDGTNAFTFARFLVPWECGFRGTALFVDGSDMLCRGDLVSLFTQIEFSYAVSVVKHDYTPKSKKKYVGTEMEADNEPYPRKNWSSVMLWNCAHAMNRCLTPEYVKNSTGAHLHRFAWLPDDRIGELPKEWNHLDEYGESQEAKLLHWTNGIPGFYQYKNAPHASEWRDTVRRMTRGLDE